MSPDEHFKIDGPARMYATRCSVPLTDFTAAQQDWIKCAAAIADISVHEFLERSTREQIIEEYKKAETQMLWENMP